MNLQLVPLPGQLIPVHNFSSYFPEIHSNIFPSVPRSSQWTPSFRFSNQIIVWIFRPSYVCYTLRPSHPPWFHLPNNIWWSEQLMKLLIMQSSPVSCHFLPLRSKYSPQLLKVVPVL
jgi:hypothetical protein